MLAVAFPLAILVLLVMLYWAFDRRRYHGKYGQGKRRPTGEVFRDPGSGRLMRVHEDPETGEREYRSED